MCGACRFPVFRVIIVRFGHCNKRSKNRLVLKSGKVCGRLPHRRYIRGSDYHLLADRSIEIKRQRRSASNFTDILSIERNCPFHLSRELGGNALQATLVRTVARKCRPTHFVASEDNPHITVVRVARIVAGIVLKNAHERWLHLPPRAGRRGWNPHTHEGRQSSRHRPTYQRIHLLKGYNQRVPGGLSAIRK